MRGRGTEAATRGRGLSHGPQQLTGQKAGPGESTGLSPRQPPCRNPSSLTLADPLSPGASKEQEAPPPPTLFSFCSQGVGPPRQAHQTIISKPLPEKWGVWEPSMNPLVKMVARGELSHPGFWAGEFSSSGSLEELGQG